MTKFYHLPVTSDVNNSIYPLISPSVCFETVFFQRLVCRATTLTYL